jgi:hypothetical protein
MKKLLLKDGQISILRSKLGTSRWWGGPELVEENSGTDCVATAWNLKKLLLKDGQNSVLQIKFRQVLICQELLFIKT